VFPEKSFESYIKFEFEKSSYRESTVCAFCGQTFVDEKKTFYRKGKKPPIATRNL